MPRIQMTPMVKIALVVLRLYLLVLLTLIGISFYRMFSKSRSPAEATGAAQVPAATAPAR